jgi:hypothetical protein
LLSGFFMTAILLSKITVKPPLNLFQSDCFFAS